MKTDLGYIRGAQGEVGPQGETGAQGPAATIEVGSVTTSAYGTPANVVNSGTENAARFDFTIPQGPPGETVADVSELTANFITESTESYPTYTTTEKMKVILGKIKKYLADLKSEAASIATALTGKLDKTDVIANLTATTSGKALDATQGKALQDQITQLNSDHGKIYRKTLFSDKISTSSTSYTPLDRINDFDFFMVSCIGSDTIVRGSLYIPIGIIESGAQSLVPCVRGGTIKAASIAEDRNGNFVLFSDDLSYCSTMIIYGFKVIK